MMRVLILFLLFLMPMVALGLPASSEDAWRQPIEAAAEGVDFGVEKEEVEAGVQKAGNFGMLQLVSLPTAHEMLFAQCNNFVRLPSRLFT